MAHIVVQKTPQTQAADHPSVVDLMAQIRNRAFQLFQSRGGLPGFEVDDWLNAERDLISIPPSELAEKDGKYLVTLSAPGFTPANLKVAALQDSIVVEGELRHEHEGSQGDVRFCDFGSQRLFRRFDLPEPIDAAKVTATLENGILRVTAAKAASPSDTQSSTAQVKVAGA